MTQTHSLDSLCTFIVNARNMDKLDAQIEQKEGLLKNLEQLETIYEKLGSQTILDRTTEEYNAVLAELLILKLKKNKLEKDMLLFQLKSLLED